MAASTVSSTPGHQPEPPPSPGRQSDGSASAAAWDEAAALRSYLASRDRPCPTCDYNLRDIRDRTCPECGYGLALHLTASPPGLAAWIALLVGLALAAGQGLAALLALPYYYYIWLHLVTWPEDYMQMLILGHRVIAVPLTGMALVLRRRFLRLPSRTQWLMVATVFLFELSICSILIYDYWLH